MKDVEIGRVEYIHVALKQEAYPSVPRLVLAQRSLLVFLRRDCHEIYGPPKYMVPPDHILQVCAEIYGPPLK